MRRLRILFSIATLTMTFAAIPQASGGGGASPGSGGLRLAGSQPTLRALGERYLMALAARTDDARAIQALAVTRQEWSLFVWPKLPASRPQANFPPDFVWQQMYLRSMSELEHILRAHAGTRYELVDLRFTGETTDFGTFKIHSGSLLRVKAPNGEEQELRLFGSVLEMKGRFKIFSFVRR
ncbi:MAG: hypothetical protein ACR2L2_07355 [Acidobacteriota bacterium]